MRLKSLRGRKANKGVGNTKNDKLLEILVITRTGKALDKAVCRSDDYKDTLKKQAEAFDRLKQAGFNEEQKNIVDRAISAANDCGAVYGVVAYRLGLHDGIKLTAELKEIK